LAADHDAAQNRKPKRKWNERMAQRCHGAAATGKPKTAIAALDAAERRAKGSLNAASRGCPFRRRDLVSDRIERPWALMRHHAGWADVFHIESETADSITGFYPDRETVGPPVNYSTRAVLARFTTLETAREAREGAVAEWRKHDAGVREAEAKLREAEKAREDAWLNCLRDAANRS
jgi:hypothetical protein